MSKGQHHNNRQSKIELFCCAYVSNGLNGAAAYRAIHPNASKRTSSVEATRYLAKPSVQEVLQPMIRKLAAKADIDAETVFRRWIEQSNGSPLDYFEITEDGMLGELSLDDLSEAQRRNLKAIKVTRNSSGETITVTVCDQQRALHMIARHLGLLSDKQPSIESDKIGDLIEKGVKRIRKAKDLGAWKDIDLEMGFDD